ncbi:D-glycero-alpha-D-manno-heptose-1,7-bisphosphate 7-phosphatase [Aurantiacibacter poecillastricola]|uniref:D-glycero-alpha-D-manno-heptose-1,7-bisphosphate 7-phosphatase n=1 Tax=Aurantiacibacter poecillastricola TaxID=3064385 RepID=UPI00273F79C5|nr:HAD-IIIA family hydrolase [Aurantiacibacter sp. 219JJ12-13]MDP5261161.1 HAD-IIIA family hydrolase [Aurantiacibacter sp. 219JJ12-13]
MTGRSGDTTEWVTHYRSAAPGECRPALLCDRDGTLIENVPYLADPRGVRLIDGVQDRLRAFRERGYLIVQVSNQSGVARGKLTPKQYALVQRRVVDCLGDGLIDAAYACPWLAGGIAPFDIDHEWRKPAPGMLLAAARDLDLDLARSIMVGDSLSDLQAGSAAGVGRLVHVSTGHGDRERAAVQDWARKGGHVVDCLESIADLQPPPEDR